MAYILEVCVDSTASALAAKEGGADRLELCADLIVGGTTPSLALVRQVKETTGLPVRALLRPRFGDFCYDRWELAQMAASAAELVAAGADGIVTGVLTPDGALDVEALGPIYDAAREAAQKAQADGAEPETEDRTLELKNVSSGDLDLATEEEKKSAEEAAKANEDLFSAMKEALGEDVVTKVTVSARLTAAADAPSCVSAEGPVSLEMEKVLSAGPAPEDIKSQRVLEVNAAHPVFAKLQAAQQAGDKDKLALYTSLLYDQALLTEGLPVADPVAFAQNVCKLMA